MRLRGVRRARDRDLVPRAVVLASGSPQRKALLAALGVRFEVVAPEIEERSEGEAGEVVRENALRKARAVAPGAGPGALVIAADTEVVIDGRVLGQPADREAAGEMLAALSGRDHEVMGGLAVLDSSAGPAPAERAGVEISTVGFRGLGPALREAYLASGEWRGRAGGYAIQGLGSALVEQVQGDVSNVIGLPVPLLLELAPELGPPNL